jgi:hypothetical protein
MSQRASGQALRSTFASVTTPRRVGRSARHGDGGAEMVGENLRLSATFKRVAPGKREGSGAVPLDARPARRHGKDAAPEVAWRQAAHGPSRLTR